MNVGKGKNHATFAQEHIVPLLNCLKDFLPSLMLIIKITINMLRWLDNIKRTGHEITQ